MIDRFWEGDFENRFILADCMDYLPDIPDNFFDLAIVDPPYGAGFTEGGGCQGWFSKYHQGNNTNMDSRGGGYWNRFGQRFDRYKHDIIPLESESAEALTSNEVERTQNERKKS